MELLFMATALIGFGMLLGAADWSRLRNRVRWRQRLDVSTRPLLPHDELVLAKFNIDLHHANKSSRTDEQIDSRFQRRRNLQDWPLEIFVANHNGAPVGFVGLQMVALIEGDERSLYITELYVVPSLRGRGVGKQLMTFATAAARERGLKGICWTVLANNLGAQRLYDSLPGVTRYAYNYAAVVAANPPSTSRS